MNNDTGIRYPEKCESELGFGKYLEFGLIKEKDTQKKILQGKIMSAKFLKTNDKDQNA